LQTKIQNAYEYATNAAGAHAAQLKNCPAITDAASESGLVDDWASEIAPLNTEWLWPQRFPLAMVSLLAGDAKLGKTTVLLDMAARITTGRDWPDGSGKAPKGRVVYFSGEDDPARTLVPRLMAAGADLTAVLIIKCARTEDGQLKTFDLTADLGKLAKRLAEISNVRLVVFDPISSYFGKTDTFRNSEVRSVLEPVARVASDHNITVIGNTHLGKSTKGAASKRVLDSVAFTATARAGYMVTKDPSDPRRRLFLPLDGNLGPPVDGLAFRIEAKFVSGDDITGSFVKWEQGAVTETADEIMAQQDDAAKMSPELKEACEFLRAFLANSPKQSIEVWEAAKTNGLAIRTVKRAIKVLGIVSMKRDMTAGWWMRLP
jgi:hypothetical protein